jgi:hypothetical protein
LNLRRCESEAFGAFLQPTCEKSFPAAVLATNGFELGTPTPHALELLAEGAFESIEADSERVQASLRHSATAQGVDDLVPAFGADHVV